jgi:hypothetical protein
MILIGFRVAKVNVREALAHTQEASVTLMHMFKKFRPKCSVRIDIVSYQEAMSLF